MKYNLSHLTQDSDQQVMGPIQDDEALLLYSLCRVMRIRNVVEVGVQGGYSARNFLAAVGPEGEVVGIDTDDRGYRQSRFTIIHASASDVRPEKIPWPIDLVFFDSHDEQAQMRFFSTMEEARKITPHTVVVIHDTGLHPGDVAHQPVERRFSNWLFNRGWSPFHAHADPSRCGPDLPYRHGLTVMCKNPYLPQ